VFVVDKDTFKTFQVKVSRMDLNQKKKTNQNDKQATQLPNTISLGAHVVPFTVLAMQID